MRDGRFQLFLQLSWFISRHLSREHTHSYQRCCCHGDWLLTVYIHQILCVVSTCPGQVEQKHICMRQTLMREQTTKHNSSVDTAGFESSLVDWRAIRPHSKWPFKVECIDRERGRGANMPENTGSSLVTASWGTITDRRAHGLSEPPRYPPTHTKNLIVSALVAGHMLSKVQYAQLVWSLMMRQTHQASIHLSAPVKSV